MIVKIRQPSPLLERFLLIKNGWSFSDLTPDTKQYLKQHATNYSLNKHKHKVDIISSNNEEAVMFKLAFSESL